MAMNSVRAVLLAPNDNVAAAIAAIDAAVPVVVTLNSPDGIVLNISSRQKIPFGHKIAIKDLSKGFAHCPLWLSHWRRDGGYKAWRSCAFAQHAKRTVTRIGRKCAGP